MTSTSRVAVRFADIDAMGHVNNAIYLSYFEQARMQFFHELIGGAWDWKTDGIVLARNEVDYRFPIFLLDTVEIKTTCDRLGDKSMTVSYIVESISTSGERRLCATGSSVLVGFNFKTGKSCAIPRSWREKLEAKK